MSYIQTAFGQPARYRANTISLNDNDAAALAVDSTGKLIVTGTITASSVSANEYTGQTTVNTTQVQVNSISHALTNGIILTAPSTNNATIYVGLTGVTTSTGDLLEPGASRGYAVNNTNLLYIISVASTTDKISYSAN